MNKQKTSKAPLDSIVAIIELYKKDVDRTLIRQNLKLTVEQRLLNLQNFMQFSNEMRKAGLETILEERQKQKTPKK